MNLDPATLGTVSILLSFVMGGLLLFAWFQNRSITALWWWGTGFFVSAVGVGVLGLQRLAPNDSNEAIAFGQALVVVGVGCKYSGCRNFNGRADKPLLAFAGAMVWLTAWPMIVTDQSAQVMLIALIAAVYLTLSSWELLRHARHKLISQHAAVTVYAAASAVCLARAVLGPTVNSGFLADVFASGWSAEWALLVLPYIPTIAVLLLCMAKERLEYESRQDGLTDSLTLLPNRRAFFLDAEALSSWQKTLPLSCLLFDLDRFKNINDHYGHQVGDQVLQAFARVLLEHVPKGAVGRLGGEEFAALIQTDRLAAESLANRVRVGFTCDRAELKSLRIGATVSVGCATGLGMSPDELLARADSALYQAKARGRNVVVSFEGDLRDISRAANLVPFRPVTRQGPSKDR